MRFACAVDLINHDRVEGPHNFVRLAAAAGEEDRGPAFIELVRTLPASIQHTRGTAEHFRLR